MPNTLLLNADGRPKSLLPLSAIHWQDAIRSIWLGSVTVLHEYEEWSVRSPSMSIRVPSVLILKKQAKINRRVRFANRLVFLRDGHTCQYCGGIFSPEVLTIDHVLPRAFGGGTRWENVTTACSFCNARRGHDVSIRPMREPYRPTHDELVRQRRRYPIEVPHVSWLYYLDWPEHAIRVVNSF
jgi:5-methylcytosine-specific restriction endonuclease McrA